MRVRKVSATGDYTFGRGQMDYWKDVPDAPAQLCQSRLYLEVGQWFLDLTEGIDYQRRVFGRHTEGTRDMEVRARILGTEGVSDIAAYSSTLNRDTRAFTPTATINTVYGAATITLGQ